MSARTDLIWSFHAADLPALLASRLRIAHSAPLQQFQASGPLAGRIARMSRPNARLQPPKSSTLPKALDNSRGLLFLSPIAPRPPHCERAMLPSVRYSNRLEMASITLP
jgi:hypothetical protein